MALVVIPILAGRLLEFLTQVPDQVPATQVAKIDLGVGVGGRWHYITVTAPGSGRPRHVLLAGIHMVLHQGHVGVPQEAVPSVVVVAEELHEGETEREDIHHCVLEVLFSLGESLGFN